VVLDLEPLALCDPVQRPGERRLDLVVERHVLDPAAARADQVVVVLGEVLRQLEVAVLVTRDDPVRDAGGDELVRLR